MVSPHIYEFYFGFHDFVVLLQDLIVCFLVTKFCCGVLFVYGRFKRTKYIFDEIKTTNQITVVSILKNLSHRYSSYYYIINFLGFKSIYFAINLSIVSSYIVFKEFVYIFLSYITLLV